MTQRLAAAILTSLSSCVVGFSASAGPFDASSSEPTAEELATPELIAEQSAIPGSGVFNVAIHFEIEPGWHLYWKNPGDTGAPMVISLDLPEGLRAGDVRWPAPQRYVHAGLLDYIYEDELTLVIPIHVDEPPTDTATITVDLEYLVCKEACLPGFATLSLTAPVASSPNEVTPTSHAPRFERAREAWPMAIDASAAGSPVQGRWDGDTLVLRVPGAEALEWYPFAPNHPGPANMVERGAAAGETLRIDYPDATRDADAVVGVIRVRRSGKDEAYEISLPPPKGG